jgi:hypothetical protein
MTDPSLDPIFAYLRQNSARFSLPALREELIRSGTDPATVDRAIAVYQSEQTVAAPRAHILLKTLLVVVVNAVLVGVMGSVPGSNAGNLFLYFVVFLVCVELLGGLVASALASSRSWGLALLLGLPLSVGLGILALGGFCLLVLAKQGPH